MAFENRTTDYSGDPDGSQLGLQTRFGNDYSDDPDGDGEGDEGIFYQISRKFICDLFIPIFGNQI